MERVILHSDLNNFYATVECLHKPELRNLPVAVCGDEDLRHGIVLAKNYMARKFNIKTGDTVWDAKKKCPNLVVVKANFPLYLKYSRLVNKIYSEYTDRIESFGIDECWLDVTHSTKIFGSGETIADEIRNRIKTELGLSVSIGVSWNKIFAKLGSDIKKPDATTVITKQNFKNVVFPLPANDLLYVGKATFKRLKNLSINTIGDIANAKLEDLRKIFGKVGEHLWTFANGYDTSPVRIKGLEYSVKSVGNSTTTHRDLKTITDVKMMITVMAESVAERLREQNFKGYVVSVSVRDKNLETWGKQTKLSQPTYLASTLTKTAMDMFKNYYDFKIPIRSVGVSVSQLCPAETDVQIDLFGTQKEVEKNEKLENTLDGIRNRYGHFSIRRATLEIDPELTNTSPKHENVIHPQGFF